MINTYKKSLAFLNNFYKLLKIKVSYYKRSKFIRYLIRIKGREERQHLTNLQKYGYSVIYDYLDKFECHQIIQAIDGRINENPELVWYGALHSDKRLFHSQALDEKIFSFFNDDFLLSVGENYFLSPLENLQTLAARLDFIEGNPGSGQGWHRDSIGKQFKAILFLSDVDINSGPFEIFPGSHRFIRILSDAIAMHTTVNNDRFSFGEIELLTQKHKPTKITGGSGTIVLVDTSTIHRGAPISSGSRYALTNYYYPTNEIANRLNDFGPQQQFY